VRYNEIQLMSAWESSEPAHVSQEASPVPDQLATERPAALTKIGHMFGSLPAKSHTLVVVREGEYAGS